MKSTNLSEENDFFNVRLQDINKEMDSILARTSQQRSDLNKFLAYGNPTGSDGAAGRSSGIVPAAPSPYNDMIVHDVVIEQAVKKHCEVQLSSWMADQLPRLLAPLVQKEVERVIERWSSQIYVVRDSQEETKRALASLHDQWRERQLAFNNAMAAVEHNARTTLQRYEAEMEERGRQWRSEMTTVADSLSEMKQRSHRMEQQGLRRMDELVRRHYDTLQSSLVDIEAQVHVWAEELNGIVRGQAQSMRSQRDALEETVARLQGSLSSTVDACNRQAVDLRTLLEDNVERRSEVRTCQRDVNRLEMLVQCAGTFMDQPTRPGTERSSYIIPLSQEIGRVQQHVSFLGGRVEGVERHLHAMDAIVQQLRTAPAIPVDNSFRIPNRSESHTVFGSDPCFSQFQKQHLQNERPKAATVHSRPLTSRTSQHTMQHELNPLPPDTVPMTKKVDSGSDTDHNPAASSRAGKGSLQSTRRAGASASDSPVFQPSSPVEMDSYQSRVESKLEAGSCQYVPAPTSDSESDRENHKLSRFAID